MWRRFYLMFNHTGTTETVFMGRQLFVMRKMRELTRQKTAIQEFLLTHISETLISDTLTSEKVVDKAVNIEFFPIS